jgi:EmrB/QacA subfamily drug resistance transporter
MSVIDGTVAAVALPSIKEDLNFPEGAIVWVMNAYLIVYAGVLLLSGRLGDRFGHRRMFLRGITLFTLASVACALANSRVQFIGARIVQGFGGAVVMTAAQSLIMMMFVEKSERAKAIGIYGFACSGGGIVGLLLGGILTDALGWRWNFFINLPIGAVVYVLGRALLADTRSGRSAGPLDLAGAITVTTSLMVAVYAVLNASAAGWGSAYTLVPLGSAALLLIAFLGIEARARAPLMPLGVFRARNMVACCVTSALFSVAMTAAVFTSLYLQLVLRYNPWQVGLTFLPSSLVLAGFSLGLSAKFVIRFGIKQPLVLGLLIDAMGLTLFARAPAGGSVTTDVLPGLLLVGLGAGMTFSPILVAAMSGAAADAAGLVSGIVNTFSVMGGAFGLAILASVSADRTNVLLASGASLAIARNGGYHAAFLIGAAAAVAGALVVASLLRTGTQPAMHPGQRLPEHPGRSGGY